VREETAFSTGAVGRRPVGLRFNPAARRALGMSVDIHEISAALVDLGGNAGQVARVAVPYAADASVVLGLAGDLALRVLEECPSENVLGVGVALPGMVTWPDGVNVFSPNFGWHAVPFKAMLERRLPLPLFVENEVRALALAEFQFGAARGRQTTVFIYVGSGVGGAVIIDGSLYRGVHGAAAEIGHNTVEPDGPLCGCGNRGCLEVFTSEKGLVARANEALAAHRPSALAALPAGSVTLEHVMSAAAAGDPLAKDLVDRAAAYLGLAVASVVDNWDPELVVLGGSVIRAGNHLLDEIRVLEQRFVLKTGTASVGVARSGLGADAALIGAAGLVIADYLAAPLALA
jgi:glucokinase-like ROK family protein